MIGSEYGYGIRDLASGTAPYSVFILIYIKILITVRLTTLVLHNLTKKSTAHLRHYLCAVLP